MNRENLKARPLSYSSLKEFYLSPKHYMHYLTKPRVETPDMLIGTATHHLLLQENFEDFFAVAPECDKRTKAGKETWEAFVAEAGEKKVLTQDQHTLVKSMADAVKAYRPAQGIFEQLGATEQKFLAEVHGLPITGFIDGLGDDVILEIKTCQSARPQDFIREAFNRMYHLQAGIYHFATGQKRKVYYIAVEKSEPFNVCVLQATDDFLQRGIALMGSLCEQFNTCLDYDLFNQGYEFYNTNGMIETLNLPAYA